MANQTIPTNTSREVLLKLGQLDKLKVSYKQVRTYNLLTKLEPKPKSVIIILVEEDEDKLQSNTTYELWPNGKRKWIASVDDN